MSVIHYLNDHFVENIRAFDFLYYIYFLNII